MGLQASSTSGSGIKVTSGSGFAIVATNTADADVIQATGSSTGHAAVSGTNNGAGFALWGSSPDANGVGIYAKGGKYAAQFDGVVQCSTDMYCGGTLNVTTDIVLANADCAEEFDACTSGAVEPGTVMVLDESGSLRASEHGYDRKVAGVVSGAGEYRPGLILDRRDTARQRVPIALVGKVYCKVDAQYSPIEVGDLLTTSPTPGHAMRAGDPMRAFGAVIGKALRPLASGQGLVPVLIALQ